MMGMLDAREAQKDSEKAQKRKRKLTKRKPRKPLHQKRRLSGKSGQLRRLLMKTRKSLARLQ